MCTQALCSKEQSVYTGLVVHMITKDLIRSDTKTNLSHGRQLPEASVMQLLQVWFGIRPCFVFYNTSLVTYVNMLPILTFMLENRKAGGDLSSNGTDSSPTCSHGSSQRPACHGVCATFPITNHGMPMCDFVRLCETIYLVNNGG